MLVDLAVSNYIERPSQALSTMAQVGTLKYTSVRFLR